MSFTYCTDGYVTVIAATRKFELLANNKLNASFNASPAIAGEAMVLRSDTHLYHIASGFERAVLETETKVITEKGRQDKNDRVNSKNRGKEQGEKESKGGEASVRQQVEDWVNYFSEASNQQISEAIISEKFQHLSTEVKRGILAVARKEYEAKGVMGHVVEKIQKSLQK